MEQTLRGVRVAIVVASGFDSDEMLAVKQSLELAGGTPFLLATTGNMVQAETSGDTPAPQYVTDGDLINCDADEFDAAFVPGGNESLAALQSDAGAKKVLAALQSANKPVVVGGTGTLDLSRTGLRRKTGEDHEAFAQTVVAFLGENTHPLQGRTLEADTFSSGEKGLTGADEMAAINTAQE